MGLDILDATKNPLLTKPPQNADSPLPYPCVTYQNRFVVDRTVYDNRHHLLYRSLKVFSTVAVVWLCIEFFKLASVSIYTLHIPENLTSYGQGGFDIDRLLPSGRHDYRCEDKTRWSYDDPDYAHSYPYSARTSFKLPSYSDSLFLLSRGSNSRGNVKVTNSPDITEVTIDISASYRYNSALQNAEVCLLDDLDNENVVGIFVGSAISSIILVMS
jgi:hypothetical protein